MAEQNATKNDILGMVGNILKNMKDDDPITKLMKQLIPSLDQNIIDSAITELDNMKNNVNDDSNFAKKIDGFMNKFELSNINMNNPYMNNENIINVLNDNIANNQIIIKDNFFDHPTYKYIKLSDLYEEIENDEILYKYDNDDETIDITNIPTDTENIDSIDI